MKWLLERLVVSGLLACTLFLPAVASAAAQVIGVELVNSTRTGRTSFDYTYRVRVQNGTPALANARAIATSTSSSTVVIKGTVNLGNLAENATTTSSDTFVIRQDRATPYDPAAITWQVTSDVTVAGALAALEASGQLPKLDRSTSLAGPDVNGNGVRDDIDAYIDSLPDSAVQKQALRQTSRAIGTAIVAGPTTATPSALKTITVAIGRGVHCIWSRYDSSTAPNKVSQIEKVTANTRQRVDAYDQYNSKISGTSSRVPNGDSCDAQ
jgi:hypothetical protein